MVCDKARCSASPFGVRAEMGAENGDDREYNEDLGDEDDCQDDVDGRDGKRSKSAIWEKLPPNVVKSTGRTIQILEFFDDHRGPANIAQVARALGYPQSSTSEIMRSLHVLGYLSYNHHGRTFMPTSRVRLLGAWANEQLHGKDRLSSLVEKLNSHSGQTAFLAIRNKLTAQYIQVAQATTSLRLHLTPGQQRPILRSASGLVLLKDVGDAEISMLVRRINGERTDQEDFISVDAVLRDVRFIRANNYLFIERSQISPGAAVIAMALPRETFPVPTVLGVGGASEILSPQKDSLVRFMSELIRHELLPNADAQSNT